MSSKKKQKTTKNRAVEYAHAYLAELQDLTLAAQIRVLREAAQLSQGQLARISGMAQSRVSLLESAEYTGFSLSTLRKLAKALDVGLQVSFAPYYRTVRQLENGNAELLRVPTRLQERQSVAAKFNTTTVYFASDNKYEFTTVARLTRAHDIPVILAGAPSIGRGVTVQIPANYGVVSNDPAPYALSQDENPTIREMN